MYAIRILLGKTRKYVVCLASEAIFECEIFSVLQLGGVAKYHDSKYTVARGVSGNFVPRFLPVLELTPQGRACLSLKKLALPINSSHTRMKFNTPTTRHVKSTHKHKLVVIYVETDGLEDGLVHYIKSGKLRQLGLVRSLF